MVVVVVVAFSSHARILGECWTVPTCTFFWLIVEISLHTLIPLFTPGLAHSGSASWDDCLSSKESKEYGTLKYIQNKSLNTILKALNLKDRTHVTYADRSLWIWTGARQMHTFDGSNQVMQRNVNYSDVMTSEKYFQMMLSCQHPHFKPCIWPMQWLLTRVSVLFSFSHISQQAYIYKMDTCGVTIFDQQTYERRGLEAVWKKKKKVIKYQQQSLTLCQTSDTIGPSFVMNHEIHHSKPAMFTARSLS